MAIKDYHNTGDDSAWSAYGIYWKGQSFIASSDYTLDSIKLKLYRTGNPGTITLSIRLTDGEGLPTGEDLKTGTTNGNSLPSGSPYEWREIDLSSGLDLTNGEEYAIIIRALSGDGSNDIDWRRDVDDGYANGRTLYSHNSGVDWGAQGPWDFLFETHESDVSYSELAGTCVGAGDGSGDLELHTYSALTGTCAGIGAGSGDLGSILVHISEQTAYKRLIVVGNDQVWIEDI